MKILIILFLEYVSCLVMSQENLIITVAKKLKVTQCIIEKRGPPQNLDLMVIKGLSKINVSSSYWLSKRIFEVASSTKWPPTGVSDVAIPLTLVVVSSEVFEEMFPLKSDFQISATIKDDYKRYELAWYKWLVVWPENGPIPTAVAHVPYDALVLVSYRNLTTNSYAIRSIYSIHNVSFDFEWGNLIDGSLHLAIDHHLRPLNGAILRRQYLNPLLYGFYYVILQPHQEMVEEIGKLLNISFYLLYGAESDFFNFDITDTLSMLERHSYTATVGPTLTLRMNIFIKDLGESPLNSYYIHPFDSNLWIVIASWILIAIVAVTIIQLQRYDKPGAKWLEHCCAVLEAFCNQGGSWDDNSAVARMTRLSTWVTVCVVIPSYTAVIISFMTVRQAYVPFKDIEGLAADGRYVLSVERGGAAGLLLATDKQFGDIVARFMVPDEEKPFSLFEATEKVCGGRHAYIGFNELIRELPAPCNIIKIEKTVTKLLCAFALKFFSPLRRVFMKQLTRFRTNGVLNRFQGSLDSSAITWEGQSALSVELELVRDLFSILVLAFPIALLVLVLEVLWSLRYKRLKMKSMLTLDRKVKKKYLSV